MEEPLITIAVVALAFMFFGLCLGFTSLLIKKEQFRPTGGGLYLAAKGSGQMWNVWHRDECARDSVFMGSQQQAIAVRNALNRLKRD